MQTTKAGNHDRGRKSIAPARPGIGRWLGFVAPPPLLFVLGRSWRISGCSPKNGRPKSACDDMTSQGGVEPLRSPQRWSVSPSCYCCVATRALGSAELVQEAPVTTSDDSKISEDRREALRYALAIGSGAALAAAVASPASAQATPDNTLDRIRANKVLRIAVLPGELPYFNKDLATGNWSGFSIEMANDIAKLLDVKLEYTESTYGNSILDLQSNKIDLGFALNPTPQRALVVDFCATVFPHPFGAMLRKGLEARTWADINKPDVNIAVDVGSATEAVARRFAPNAMIKSLKSRDEVMLEMSSGRVDCVVNALVLGLTAIAKNPNLGTYKILQSPSVAIPSSMAVRREPDKRWRDFLSVWVDYNRGIGQMREWFIKGLSLSGVKPEDVPVELNI